MLTMRIQRTQRTTRMFIASATLMISPCVFIACDEDRPTAVVQAPPPAPHPNEAPPPNSSKEKNPISGNRKSTYGKAYDVAERLADEQVPEYNRRLEEEIEKGKQGR